MRVIVGSPDPDFEPIIFDVVKNNYLVKEYYDKDDKDLLEHLFSYAFHVVKGRWPKAESIIMKDPEYAYCYTCFIIKGRWPEAESVIMKSPYHAYYYACDFIKGRWPEAEQYIMKDSYYWDEYCRFCGEVNESI